jgi:hypothetical protein
MTSGSHSMPYANWALPGAAGERIMEGGKAWCRLDNRVVGGVNTRLIDTLAWARKINAKRISCELASSGSEGAKGNLGARIRNIQGGDDVSLPSAKH